MMIKTAGIVGLLVVTLGVAGCSLFSRGAYESAAYKVVEKEGAFEIREYPDLAVVSTKMKVAEGGRKGDDGSFMRLFGYISGENEGKQKVAMTTPVFMDEKEDRMSFVLPAETAKAGAPDPKGEGVALATRPGGRYVVYQFNGTMNERAVAEARKKLDAWVKKKGLKASGEGERAGYDPPFTLPLLRRNEVLMPVE